jgi:hypothetical protein
MRPAVRLMNRLRYPQKLGLIVLLIAAPLGLTLFLWLAEVHERIAFAEKERAGLAYVVALHGLLEQISLGQPAGVIAAATLIDGLDRRIGQELETRELWADVREPVLDAGSTRSERSVEVLRVVAHAGDASNLILDPDLDSYYLMDAVVTRLPELAAQLVAVSEPLEPAERTAKLGVARALLEGIERGHAVAFPVGAHANRRLQQSRGSRDPGRAAPGGGVVQPRRRAADRGTQRSRGRDARQVGLSRRDEP